MNRIRVGVLAVGCALALLLGAGVANAQGVTGRVVGRVLDKDFGNPLSGVTVIVQGPQGEDGTITDDKGDYSFSTLPVGTYVIRFYLATAATQVEQPDVQVQAEKTVRVNARIAGAAQNAPTETYVIKAKSPSVDVGSARVGATFDEDFTKNMPVGRTFGDVVEKAPGAFIDPTGNISIGGSTGLENIYLVNGLNVTGMEFGNLDSGLSSIGGGTNLPVEFLKQIDVSSGGYTAEFGGGMGGVISTVLKSGTNQFHGSAFGFLGSGLADPTVVEPRLGGVLASRRLLDTDTTLGFELGGPLIKDKAFFWVGFAPRLTDTHVDRMLFPKLPDGTSGKELTDQRLRLGETHRTYAYAATIDLVPSPDHHTTLALWGTPSFNTQMRSFQHLEANASPNWSIEKLDKVNTDVMLHHLSQFNDRHLLLEANLGLHHEYFDNRSPAAALNQLNQLEYWGANLYDLEHIDACKPVGTFQPCPVDNYHTGGFGQTKTFSGNRGVAEVKATFLSNLFGIAHGEGKIGARGEGSVFEQDRFYSGPLGNRALVQLAPNGGSPNGSPFPYFNTTSFFTLPKGQSATDFGGMDKPFTDFLNPPYYQDHLKARVTSASGILFAQEALTPAALTNLTVNLGVRYERQRISDYNGTAFLDTDNWAPRLSAIYDPMNDGRSKISASYGTYFESVPMNLAARYFGGEGLLVRNNVPLANCPNGTDNAYTWTGSNEWRGCGVPPLGGKDADGVSTSPFNNGSTYPVQSHLKGQYHNEVVATIERELMDDLTVRLDYTHRWLGNIIEDGTSDPSGSFAFVLANPGNVPPSSITDATNDVKRLSALDQTDPLIASQTAAAQQKLANLKGMAAAPKPERTYDALTLSVNKRFSRNWRARGSYTYSRLVGNYEGLYQVEGDYFAPNGGNAYDTPDLYVNQRGRLPNDHPHQGRVDGYYTLPVSNGNITFGLGWAARSGMPRNYISSWYFNQPQNMLLPRGSGGRTPPTSQLDLHIAYQLRLTSVSRLEATVDIFNVMNQQATVMTDDVYTYDLAPAIVNGNTTDLKFAKNFLGAPITKNPGFGHAVAYQAPISGRFGLRLTF